MLNVVVGFVCDFPGCGETVTKRGTSPEPRLGDDDLDPPDGWMLLQVVGQDEARLYCLAHPVRLDGNETVIKRRVGFELTQSASRNKSSETKENA